MLFRFLILLRVHVCYRTTNSHAPAGALLCTQSSHHYDGRSYRNPTRADHRIDVIGRRIDHKRARVFVRVSDAKLSNSIAAHHRSTQDRCFDIDVGLFKLKATCFRFFSQDESERRPSSDSARPKPDFTSSAIRYLRVRVCTSNHQRASDCRSR